MIETGLTIYANDLDFTSIYPSDMRANNVSRMTLKFAPFEMTGRSEDALRRYFTDLVNVRENAVTLCSEYHGLPNYSEMKKRIAAELEA